MGGCLFPVVALWGEGGAGGVSRGRASNDEPLRPPGLGREGSDGAEMDGTPGSEGAGPATPGPTWAAAFFNGAGASSNWNTWGGPRQEGGQAPGIQPEGGVRLAYGSRRLNRKVSRYQKVDVVVSNVELNIGL